VVVTPNGVGQVWQGTTVQFRANVPVFWSVLEGSAGGTINSNGLYAAPSLAGTFHIVATSQADTKITGTGFVEVPPLTIQISPPAEMLRVGGQRQFSGFALAADQHVTWRLQEGAAAGEITVDGLYTAPNTTGVSHLIATSVFNPKVSNTATVTVVSEGFVSISNMDTARYGHTATLLLDGRVLVGGGTTDTAHSAELFDPASSGFTTTSGAMVHVRSGHCAALLMNGKVLLAGGSDSRGNLFTTGELFDPATGTFSATGELNQARKFATATLLPGGKVLIAGGQDSGGTMLSSAELYDPSTGSFTPTGRMHVARVQHTATLLSNGKVLLVGGTSKTGSSELFDPASGLFSASGSLAQARSQHTATLLPNGNVLILGGSQIMPPVGGGAPAAPVSLDRAELYHAATGTFSNAGKLRVARASHSATLLPNGVVLVAGGYDLGFDGDADPYVETMFAAELFNPTTFNSTPATSLVSARAEHTATVLNNGQVLVTGGRSESQELCCHPHPFIVNLMSAELYK
jgi:WD40 repeat protein